MEEEKPQPLPLEARIKETCREYRLNLKPEIGQHLLISEEVLSKIVETVPHDATVIEIGAGPGQLTEVLAKKASQVVAIELDRQFEAPLEQLERGYPNLTIVFGNALSLDFKKLVDIKDESVELVGSLPYHITEPLIVKTSTLPIEGATFLVGARFSQEIQARDENSPGFGKLTLLTNTFFLPEILDYVSKESFYPQPRTKSAIIRLSPRENLEFLENKTLFLLRELFWSAQKTEPLKNVLSKGLVKHEQVSTQGIRKKKKAHRRQRRKVRQILRSVTKDQGSSYEATDKRRKSILTLNQARKIIATLNLPETLLNKPVGQLNNPELGRLYSALSKEFGLAW